MSVRWHRGGWWGRCLLWAPMRAGLARGISTHYASMQLNTTRAAVHGWKQAEKICVTHAQTALKDRADREKYSATGKSCTESREQK